MPDLAGEGSILAPCILLNKRLELGRQGHCYRLEGFRHMRSYEYWSDLRR
jgi:hypothetical protein